MLFHFLCETSSFVLFNRQSPRSSRELGMQRRKRRRSSGVCRNPRLGSYLCIAALALVQALPLWLFWQGKIILFLGYGHFVSFEIVLWEFGGLREG